MILRIEKHQTRWRAKDVPACVRCFVELATLEYDGILERVMHFEPLIRYIMGMARKPYPSDVSDDEWAFVAPYLILMDPDALSVSMTFAREFNGLRWIVRTGSPWRYMPNDLPPWYSVYQQSQRWLKAEVFTQMAHDLREILRLINGRTDQPSAAVLDSRTLQSMPESGHRAGYDGAKKKKGSKIHMAVDTLGHLLALHVTPANEQDRTQVGKLAEAVQEATKQSVQVAFVDQGLYRNGCGG